MVVMVAEGSDLGRRRRLDKAQEGDSTGGEGGGLA
jgi:hypothetical protein